MHRDMATWYRTRDGMADYGFSFERDSNGTWRAFITSQPSYRGADDGLHATHRLRSTDGRYYVCWTGSIYSLDEIMAVARLWADATQDYIRYGRRF